MPRLRRSYPYDVALMHGMRHTSISGRLPNLLDIPNALAEHRVDHLSVTRCILKVLDESPLLGHDAAYTRDLSPLVNLALIPNGDAIVSWYSM